MITRHLLADAQHNLLVRGRPTRPRAAHAIGRANSEWPRLPTWRRNIVMISSPHDRAFNTKNQFMAEPMRYAPIESAPSQDKTRANIDESAALV